jgi:hypothetical protein
MLPGKFPEIDSGHHNGLRRSLRSATAGDENGLEQRDIRRCRETMEAGYVMAFEAGR